MPPYVEQQRTDKILSHRSDHRIMNRATVLVRGWTWMYISCSVTSHGTTEQLEGSRGVGTLGRAKRVVGGECKHGHALTGDNVIFRTSMRHRADGSMAWSTKTACAECQRQAVRRHYDAKRPEPRVAHA